MKNRFSKIFVLVLSLALVIGVALAVSVSAEETKPQIISKNINYGEKFVIVYAVDAATVAEGPVTLKVYSDAEKANLVGSYTVAAPGYEEKLEKDIYKIYTNGIAPKDLADIFYAQAIDAEGNESDVISYSVVEYMLQRLYGGYELSPEQTAMYTKSLEFGAAAQDLLAAADPIRVNDYKYIRVEGGTVNGVTKGMFVKDTVVTLANSGNSTLKGWNANSENESKLYVGNSFTVTDNYVITAITGATSVGYYDAFGGKSYDGLTTNVWNSFVKDAADLIDRMDNMSTDVTYETAPSTNRLTMVKESTTNTVLELGRAETYYGAGASFKITGGSGNCLSFETDLYMSNTPGLYFNIGYSHSSAAATNATFVDNYAQYNVTYKDGGFELFDTIVAPETWVNVCAELYTEEGIIKYYVNGINTLTETVGSAPDITHFTFYIPGENTRNTYVRFDNTYFAAINKSIISSTEYETFNNGTIPSNITYSFKGGVSELKVTDAPWLNTTEKALTLVSNKSNNGDLVYFDIKEAENASKVVFEAKYFVEAAEGATFPISQFIFAGNNKNQLGVIKLLANASTNNYQIQDYISGGSGHQTANSTAPVGSWITIRLEGYNADDTFCVDVYINGAKLMTSKNTKWADTNISDISIITLEIPAAFIGNVYIDDVKCVKE